MFCSISGEVPEEPVVSTKSGHIFELRLIQKQVEATGKCPVTDGDLTLDDLIPLQVVNKAVRPRPPQATSLAGLLKNFQGEWDSLMLETFSLRQHLDTVRQELSHALYQHDAACRVIARLIQERDEARSALADTRANMAAAAGSSTAMEVETTGIDQAVRDNMQATAKTLSKQRKKKFKAAVSEAVASSQQLAAFGVSQTSPLHLTTDPGIVALDLHPTKPSMVLTGGQDGNLIVFNKDTKKVSSTNKGHKEKITSVAFHPTQDILLSASADNTANIWNTTQDDKYVVAVSTSCHSGPVVDVSLHATGDYFATASEDKTWAFHDIITGKLRTQVSDSNKSDSAYTGLEFHPDGLILATGSVDSTVRIWDVINQTNVASFEGHVGGVSALAFSENGYYLASADVEGVVKLWDLRKLKNFQTLSISDVKAPVNDLHFDASGQHLAAAGNGVTLFDTKSWDVVKRFNDHSKTVTGVRFGQNAQFLASVSMDRNLNIYQQ